MKKRILAATLSLIMFLTLSVPLQGRAESVDPTAYTPQAQTLKALGLFLGGSAGFELDKTATRAQAAVMLVRLLGKEVAAKQGSSGHPFQDVPAWASDSVGYLYQNGLANGISASRFGSDQLVTPAQYATFMLRALGYSDAEGDFQWKNALLKAISVGMLTDDEGAMLLGMDTVPRGHMVLVSYKGLFTFMKNSGDTLLESLFVWSKAFSEDQLAAAAAVDSRIAAYITAFGELNTPAGAGVVPVPAVTPAPAFTPTPASGSSVDKTIEQIAQLSSHVVYLINKDASGQPVSIGSGFLISKDGIIVTNYHVIEGATSMSATLEDGRTAGIEAVLAYDVQKDLAILKASTLTMNEGLALGDSSAVNVGQSTVAIGNPLGLSNTVSSGIISSIRFSEERDADDFQISNPVSGGSSGGPLFNMKGEVIGVIYAGMVEGQNLNFAIPVSDVKSLMTEISPMSFAQVNQQTGAAGGEAESGTSGDEEIDVVIQEVEPNDAPVQADAFTEEPVSTITGLAYGEITDTLYDMDYYRLDVAASGELMVFCVWVDDATAEDLYIMIEDADGNPLAASEFVETDTTTAQAAFLDLEPGTYFISVMQSNETDGARYVGKMYGLYCALE